MRRIVIALFTAILCLSLGLPTISPLSVASAAPQRIEGTSRQQGSGVATVKVAKLNVRRAPRTTAPVIGSLSLNVVVPVIGRDRLASWLEVDTAFGRGWINSQYVTTDIDVLRLPMTMILPYVIVIANPFANVRSGPFRGYPVIAEAPYRTDLDLIGLHSQGLAVQVMLDDGRIGWIDSEVVSINGDLADTPTTDRTVLPLAEINAYRVRVRSAPSATASIVATVGLRQQYTILGQTSNGNYYLIKGSFGSGYILTNYVRVIGYKNVIPVVK